MRQNAGRAPKPLGANRIARYVLFASVLAASGCARVRVAASPASAPSTKDFVFVAEPSFIAPGETATLRWNIQGATSVTIEEAAGTGKLHLVGEFGASGTLPVRPRESSTYVVACKGSTTFSCASVSVHVRLVSP